MDRLIGPGAEKIRRHKRGWELLAWIATLEPIYPLRARQVIDQAAAYFEQAARDSADSLAWHGLGTAWAAAGRAEEAQAALETSLRLDADNPVAQSALSWLRRPRTPRGAGLPGSTCLDVRVDLDALLAQNEAAHNGSIIRWQGRTWLAFRTSPWHSRLAVVELGADWQPVGRPHRLQLERAGAPTSSHEDPRLFVHDDRLHVTYLDARRANDGWIASVHVAELSPEMAVEGGRELFLFGQRKVEKNWGVFSPDGELYARANAFNFIHLTTPVGEFPPKS